MLLESCNSYPIRATTNMQARLMCKRASMHRGSLDVDLTVDENLALKSPHHYLVKLCKKPLDVSTSKGPPSSLAHLHLKLVCITVVPHY
jgi:hypothetical protein